MDESRVLLVAGIVLLSTSALLGFVQERHRDSPEAFAQWRVVHAGGAGGAVQLLALAAVWHQFGATGWKGMIAWGVILASWAFFLGPLARAMGMPAASRAINIAGAIIAAPSYLLLPVLVVG